MEQNWLLYVSAFGCSFGLTLATTPIAKILSVKMGAIDMPRERGMHKEPIPRMGGLAIIFGFLMTMAVMTPFVEELRSIEFLGVVIGAFVITACGMIDDIKELKPGHKFAFEIIAALIVTFSGTRISFVHWPMVANLEALSVPITIVWIVGITNAVNFIDGLDGLAAGVSSIGALCLTALCILSENLPATFLSAAIAGSCFGFLPRNFNPAELIMGDTGALFLGYILSVMSIFGVFKSYAILSIVIAFFVLALPIFDMSFVTIKRTLSGKSFKDADRGHLHHRLIDAGLTTKRAVVILYILSAVSAIIAFLIAIKDLRALSVAIIFIVIFLVMLFVYRKRQ